MAHLWLHDDEGWAVLALDSSVSAYELLCPSADDVGFTVRALKDGELDRQDASESVRLLTTGDGVAETWVLLCEPGAALVNAEAVVGGCRVLQDRDEIRVKGAQRAFFSTDAEVRVSTYSGCERPLCPRCKTEIECGAAAVRCPSCGIWYHQGETPCFTYMDSCATCSHPTEIGAGLRWSPEGL